MEIPAEDFIYLDDNNDNGIPDFFENSINWKYIDDTDGDGVPDIIEVNTGTDPNNPDGDVNDILDGYTLEMMYKNPLLIWSDESNSLKLYGDLNSDYIIDAFDLVLMRQLVINNNYSEYADLDDDGDVDAEDLNWLSNYLLLKVKSFPVYNKFDSDNDGLTDYVEVENYGTSPHKADTDGDKLSDYFELFLMKTNPLIPDNIASEDPDNDGLTNAQESKYNTDPYSDDTDEDGLTDWEELKAIGTDPLLPDTDGDGLTDYDEVEALYALDPLNPNTNGAPDGKRIIKQIISEDDPLLSEVNAEDNAYALSIEINSSGNAKRLLSVEKSGYYNVMKDGSAVGFIPEFNYPDAYDVESITFNFRIKDGYKDNVMNIFAEEGYITNNEFKGVKRFTIFKYFEDIDMQMPIENACTIIGDTVSVTLPKESFEDDFAYSVHNIGSYSLVDLEVWGMMMNNNLMSDDDMEALSAIENTSIAPVSNEVSDDYGISTYNLVDDDLNSIMNIMKNYSKTTYNTNVNNNFNTKVVGGHVYALINSDLDWVDAQYSCNKMGGHLMIPSSYTELGALMSEITSGNTKNCYWIGAYYNNGWKIDKSEDSPIYKKELNGLKTLSVPAVNNNRKYTIDSFKYYKYGDYLYYADGLYYGYVDSNGELNRNKNIAGYICEWDSYAQYLNYLKTDAIEGTDKKVVSSFFGNFVLNGSLSENRDTDTDEDGVPDYDELNKKLLERVNKGKPGLFTVKYVDIVNYLSKSEKGKNLVSAYSTNSKINKILNYTMVTTTSTPQNPDTTTTVVGTAPVVTSPVFSADKTIIEVDSDGDYMSDYDEDNDNSDYTNSRKAGPTPINPQILDDSDMFTTKPVINNTNNTEIGGGENKLMSAGNNYTKVKTSYNRHTDKDAKFLICEDTNTTSCFIVEVVLTSKTLRDFIYENNKNFIDVYSECTHCYKYKCSQILAREIVDSGSDYIIRYTIEINNFDDCSYGNVIEVNKGTVYTDYAINIYKESYTYAPDGGMAFKDIVHLDNYTDYRNYQSIFIDDATFREISDYDGYYNEDFDTFVVGRVNSRIADDMMYYFNNEYYDAYELRNKIKSITSNTFTFVGLCILIIDSASIIGNVATVAGALATSSNLSYSISKEHIEDDLELALNEAVMHKFKNSGNEMSKYDIEYKNILGNDKLMNIIKNDNIFNICLESFNYDTLFISPSVDWSTWDGQFIHRIIGNSVLNVSTDIEIKNPKDLMNFEVLT